MSNIVAFPGDIKVCPCGWRMPKKISVEVRVDHVRVVDVEGHPNVTVEFDCPGCEKRFAASFAPGSVTIEQEKAAVRR